jgi:hypothetical protein
VAIAAVFEQYTEREWADLLHADTIHAFLNFCGMLSAGRHAIELIAVYLRSELT